MPLATFPSRTRPIPRAARRSGNAPDEGNRMRPITRKTGDNRKRASKNRPGDRMFAALLIGLSVALLAVGYRALAVASDKSPAERRAAAAKAQQEGNFRDAFDGFSRLVLDPADDAAEAPNDM